MNKAIKSIKIDDISIDGGTQQRESINNAEVESYAEAMRCGAKFPPVVLFFDGAQYWLADGFHRYHACRIAPIQDIEADVRPGTCREARLYSAGANGGHGIRPTNADKRKAVLVLLVDAEWSVWSDSAIARHCKVTQPFVGKLRNELAPKTKTSKPDTPITVIGESAKPAPVLKGENENTGVDVPESTPPESEYNPADDALAEAHETVRSLSAENDTLRDIIAVGNLPEPERTAGEIIADLRREIKTLTATLEAVTSSRDQLMTENASLKRQCEMNGRELKKLRKVV